MENNSCHPIACSEIAFLGHHALIRERSYPCNNNCHRLSREEILTTRVVRDRENGGVSHLNPDAIDARLLECCDRFT